MSGGLVCSCMSGFKPIDTTEGPTLWARKSGEHTVELREGIDPEDPINRFYLSESEIEVIGREFFTDD